jgi:DNA modification methylase
MPEWLIQNGDALEELRQWPDGVFDCCVTSPPYWRLRDYHVDGQIGLEDTPEHYVEKLVAVFHEVRRVLSASSTLWLVIGDSFARDERKGRHKPGECGKQNYVIEHGGGRVASGIRFTEFCYLKPKDLIGVPWRLAFALQADGWYLRSDIIWAKSNPMPESVTDRPTRSHEYLFLLSKSSHYYFDSKAIAEPCVSTDARRFTDGSPDKQRGHSRRHTGFSGRYADTVASNGAPTTRNKRDVWTVATSGYSGAHFAVFPPALITPCILAGCPAGGYVLDPFCGSGVTLKTAVGLGRNAVGIELNGDYCRLVEERMNPPVRKLKKV